MTDQKSTADYEDIFHESPVAEKMVNAGDMVGGYAAAWGRRVIENAEAAGLTKQSVDEMRERMAKWLTIVTLYKKEMLEVRHDERMGADFKKDMLHKMKRNLDATRVKLFGG